MTNTAEKPASIHIKQARIEDLIFALKAGWRDFTQYPLMSGFFGFVYMVLGNVLVFGLFYFEKAWLVLPVAVGFPLIAPFAAAGLYEISRRREIGAPVTFSAVLGVVWQQRKKELGWMAFTVLFVFWVWVYQVRLLLALMLSRSSFSSLDRMSEIIFFSSEGWLFLAVGTCVGAFLSAILFSLTVIAMPLLLDNEVDFITAMITSVQTVLKSPGVMLFWGGTIALVLIVSMIPAFLGLIFTLPILGHATWHIYRRLINV